MTWKAKVKQIGIEHVGSRVAERQPRRQPFPLSYWDLSVDDGGAVVVDGRSIEELVASFGSPLHVVQANRLDAVCKEALAPLHEGNGANVFYSYKTNPVPGVLERIHTSGIGAEVISAYEYWLARQLGVPGDRIIYNGPAKSAESIAEAIAQDTLVINANSLGDLRVIEEQAKAVGKPANAGIRVALPGGWGGQFGLEWDSPAVADAVRLGVESPHLNFIGFHSHRGVTMRTIDEVNGYLDAVLGFVEQLHASTGWYPGILDIGGSLACPSSSGIPTTQYRLNRALGSDVLPPDPTECVTTGAMSREAHRRASLQADSLGVPQPLVTLEPGRALTADSQFLVATVHDVKTDRELPHLVVDAGINIAESVSHAYHQLIPATNPDAPADTSYRVVGPICTPADVLYNNWRLPNQREGDRLLIMDTGAYCVPFSTSFSFPRPAIVEVGNGEPRLLRRAETYEDVISRDTTSPGGAAVGEALGQER